jgi:hypothetical protein
MAIAFRCERCGKQYQVDQSLAGRRGRCKQCGHPFSIPGPAAGAREPGVDDDGIAVEEDEVVPAPATAAKVAKAKKTSRRRLFALSTLPPWGYWTYVGVIFASLAASLVVHGEMKLLAALVGGFLAVGPFVVSGFLYHYGIPFGDGLVTGLMYLFVFPYRIHYRLTHKEAFARVELPSMTLRDVGALLLALLSLPVLFRAAEEMDELTGKGPGRVPSKRIVVHVPQPPPFEQPAAEGWRPDFRKQAAIPRAKPLDTGPAEAAPVEPAPRRPAITGPSRPGPMASDPMPTPTASAYDQHEALTRDVLVRMNELADLLATIGDAASAQAVTPRSHAIAGGFDDDQRRFDRLPGLSAEDAAKLRDRYEEDQKAAVARYGRELARVRSIPGAAPFLSPDPLASRPFLPGTNLRIVAHSTAGPSGPRFGPPQPPPAAEAELAVTVNVTGVNDLKTGEMIGGRITEVMKAMGGGYSMRSNTGGGRMSVTVAPVADPRAFADKLTFGKVTRVEGRIIDVAAGP